jgi:hypothetical protein
MVNLKKGLGVFLLMFIFLTIIPALLPMERTTIITAKVGCTSSVANAVYDLLLIMIELAVPLSVLGAIVSFIIGAIAAIRS